MQEQVCKNCGNNFTGKFCNNCGEKVYTAHDKKLSHIFEEAFHFITHLDGKFLKSLRLIFFKPGFLALDYCRGIRKQYFKPISLFFILVIVYLLLPASFSPGLNMPFSQGTQTFRVIGVPIVENLARQKAQSKQISFEELAVKYDEKSPKVAKFLLFIILPLAAGVLYLLFKKQSPFYFDHFILSTEITTQFIALLFFIIPLFLKLVSFIVEKISGSDLHFSDRLMAPTAMILLLSSWTVALSRFYKVSRMHAFLKSLLFFVFYFIITFFIYKFILFFIVLLFI